MSTSRKLAYNVVASSISKVLSTVGALVNIALITRYLGQEDFGWYITALAFFMFFNAFGDWGLYQTATREISRPNADEKGIMNKMAGLRITISFLVVALSPIIVAFLPYPPQLKIALIIVAFAFLFSSFSQVLVGLFQKRLIMDRIAYAELAGKILQVLLVYLCVKYDLGFNAIVGTLAVIMLVNFLVIAFLSRKFIKIKPEIDLVFWKKFLIQTAPLGLSVFITFIYFKADSIILSLMQPAADVGTYGAAYKIVENLSYFPAMIVGLTMPMFAFNVFSDREKFKRLVNKNFKVFLIIVIPLVIGTMFLAEGIIDFIAGPEFTASANILRIIIFSIAFIFFGHLFNTIMIAAKLQKQLFLMLLATAIFNLTLNLTFIPKYSFYATSIISVATEVLVVTLGAFITLKYLKLIPKSDGIASMAISGLLMALFLWYFSFLPFFSLVLLSPIIYFTSLLATGGINKDEIMLLLKKE